MDDSGRKWPIHCLKADRSNLDQWINEVRATHPVAASALVEAQARIQDAIDELLEGEEE